MKRVFSPIAVVLSISIASLVSTAPGTVHADAGTVSPTGKGIAGGILLGAEVGFVGLSAAGVRAPWAYYTIPAVLAAGGGIGGYFVEKANESGEAPMAMLAAGMALVIPSVVFTLNATHYQPASEDSTPIDATPADASASGTISVGAGTPATTPGSPSTTTPAAAGSTSTTPAVGPARRSVGPTSDGRTVPLALLNLSPDAVALALPLVSVRPTYTLDEVARFGLSQRYEVHAPLLTATF